MMVDEGVGAVGVFWSRVRVLLRWVVEWVILLSLALSSGVAQTCKHNHASISR